MRAQFEATTYEKYLISELAHTRSLFFPPGQVTEDIVSFAVGVRNSKRAFWRLFPHMYPRWRRMLFQLPPGTPLGVEWWLQLEQEIENFPKFKFNCFIQARRPERMEPGESGTNAPWKKPYFRYDLAAGQHQALATLAKAASANTMVVYASPAFCTSAELWAAIDGGTLVERSSFCEAAKLKSRSRYCFSSAGGTGVIQPGMARIKSAAFDRTLEALNEVQPVESNLAFLIATAEAVHGAAEQLGDQQETYQAVVASLFKESASPLAAALARIYAFQFACNVQLMIGYAD
jgi:hypothetical protein